MKTVILFLILGTISESLSDNNPYCNLQSCISRSKKHIFCPSTPKYKCDKNVTNHEISEQEQDRIVEYHNKLRQKIVNGQEPKLPPAAEMEIMVWDEELASMARAWTDQCHIGHNECSDNFDGWVGQNYVLTSSRVPKGSVEVETQILQWYNEINDFDPNNLNRPFLLSDLTRPPLIGHFTQLVWSKTNKIGCSRIIYDGKYEYNMYFLVCNYSPSGNIGNELIYPLATSTPQQKLNQQERQDKKSQYNQKTYAPQTEQERQEQGQREQEKRWGEPHKLQQDLNYQQPSQQEEQRRQYEEYQEALRKWDDQRKKEAEEEEQQQQEYQEQLKAYNERKQQQEEARKRQEGQQFQVIRQQRQQTPKSYGVQSQESYKSATNSQPLADWDKHVATWLKLENQVRQKNNMLMKNELNLDPSEYRVLTN